jgi:hypothetical protein
MITTLYRGDIDFVIADDSAATCGGWNPPPTSTPSKTNFNLVFGISTASDYLSSCLEDM